MQDTITSVTRSSHRWISDTKTVIFPGKIRIIPFQVPPNRQKQNARGVCALGRSWEGVGETGLDIDMRLWTAEPNGEDRVTAWAEGLELRKRLRILGASSRPLRIRVGCCTLCSRSWRIVKLNTSSPGWSVKGEERQSWWWTLQTSPRMEMSAKERESECAPL